MARFIIKGCNRISGTFRPAGNKNAALPMLAATLLTDQPVYLTNVPQITDVKIMLELLVDLGVRVEEDKHALTLCAENISKVAVHKELYKCIRGSILLAGPLAARCGQAKIYQPGGDVIGRRRLDTHILGLRALGVEIELKPSLKSFRLKTKKLCGADIILDEASVTATENIVMAACLAEGRTTIYNAACEPHVQDLCHLLNKMGACISGIGTNLLTIDGVERLNGATHRISPDYIEAGSFIAAAAATGGVLKIPAKDVEFLRFVERAFQKIGIRWNITGKYLTLPKKQERTIDVDVGNAVPKIEDGVWPAFPSDLMSVVLVLATQSQGNILFFEKLFESRLYFVDHLIDMGAQIIQCDPHRVMVSGPNKLHGARLTSPDIRAGMGMIIAALCADGESIVENADMIDRGYENIDLRLQKLGADIVRD